jgi:hypothetical protein
MLVQVLRRSAPALESAIAAAVPSVFGLWHEKGHRYAYHDGHSCSGRYDSISVAVPFLASAHSKLRYRRCLLAFCQRQVYACEEDGDPERADPEACNTRAQPVGGYLMLCTARCRSRQVVG